MGKLDDIHDDIRDLAVSQARIETRLDEGFVTKDDCVECHKEVDGEIRKVGIWNKIAALFATIAVGLVGYFGWRK